MNLVYAQPFRSYDCVETHINVRANTMKMSTSIRYCISVAEIMSHISWNAIRRPNKIRARFFHRICRMLACTSTSTTSLCTNKCMNFVQILFAWAIFLYITFDSKLKEHCWWRERKNWRKEKAADENEWKHQRDDENVNSVSDKAKNLKQSWAKSKRMCIWCGDGGGWNHVCHGNMLGAVFAYLSLSRKQQRSWNAYFSFCSDTFETS